MRKTQIRLNGRHAFTLIEMMIVVAIIAILVGAVFKLMSAAGEKNKESTTVTRIERLQNALSGYYAEYGSYPPVMQYEYPDPERERPDGDREDSKEVAFSYTSANKAASSQSVAFEYPPLKSLDNYIIFKYKDSGAISAGLRYGGVSLSGADFSDWYKYPLFKLGLLSYLLPKAHIAWGSSTSSDDRYARVFMCRQWASKKISSDTENNEQIAAQMDIEKRTVARWLPNFEKIICGGETQMGIELCEPNTGVTFTMYSDSQTSTKYVVQKMTINDGWGNELYYYSPAPYQSYRIWSSGPDGKTFPPWIPIKGYPHQTDAAQWVEDDIVRFDH